MAHVGGHAPAGVCLSTGMLLFCYRWTNHGCNISPTGPSITDMYPELVRMIMLEVDSTSDLEALRLSCSAMHQTIKRFNYPDFQAEWLLNRHGAEKAMGQSLLLTRQPHKVIKVLIDTHGADINSMDFGSRVTVGEFELGVLQLACLGWHPASLEVVKLLVTHPGLVIDQTWISDSSRWSRHRRTLEWVCSVCPADFARSMIPQACPGADSLQRVPTADIIRELLKHPDIDVNADDPDWTGPALHMACATGDTATVSVLLQHEKTNINAIGGCSSPVSLNFTGLKACSNLP